MTTALGIRPDSKSQGVSPQVHRHIISAQWASDGIIQGLDVTGGADRPRRWPPATQG